MLFVGLSVGLSVTFLSCFVTHIHACNIWFIKAENARKLTGGKVFQTFWGLKHEVIKFNPRV